MSAELECSESWKIRLFQGVNNMDLLHKYFLYEDILHRKVKRMQRVTHKTGNASAIGHVTDTDGYQTNLIYLNQTEQLLSNLPNTRAEK